MSPGAVPPVDPVKITGSHVGSRIVMGGKGDVHQWRQHSLTRDFHFLHLQMTMPVPLLFLTRGRTVDLRGTYEHSLGEVTTLPTYSLPQAAVSTRVVFHGISKVCSAERSWRHLRY